MTTTITKIQREVLEAAARRNDYAALPIRGSKLNAGSATRIMKELIRKGLVIEKPAVAKAPIWGEDVGGRPLMAVISDEGLSAIGMQPAGKVGRRSRAVAKKAPRGPSSGPWRPYRRTSPVGRGQARSWRYWSRCSNATEARRSRKWRLRRVGRRTRFGA
jgi:hypothetical protein